MKQTVLCGPVAAELTDAAERAQLGLLGRLRHRRARPLIVSLDSVENRMEPLSIVTGVAAIGPGIALFGYGLRNFAKDQVSRAWPTVEGHVDAVRGVEGYRGIRHLQLTYEYSVDGRRWPAGVTGRHADGFIKQHPRGSTLKVYHNPSNPAEALIMPGASLGHLLVFALSVAFVGLGLLAFHSAAA